MNKQKQSAFTLVELIVVITILAILGTIAFISLQGYSSQSRDSVRISDMASIKTGLELFNLDAGKYPSPSDETIITYSGATAWTQGYFGEQTTKNVDKLDKIPTDPLTDKKYVYSTTNTRQEFQLAGIMEGDQVTFLNAASSPLISGELRVVSASEKTARIKILGNYNGKILKLNTGSIDYVLAIPSLITSSGTDLQVISTNNYLAYNGYKNLPFQYTGTYKTNGETNLRLVNVSNLLVFAGDIKNLSKTDQVGIDARISLISNLQNAYTGTVIKSIGEIAQILTATGTSEIEILSTAIVRNNLGGSIIASSSSSGGGGNTTPTAIITETTCFDTGWIWVNGTLDTQGDGFCISPRIQGGTEFISWSDIGTNYSWTRTGSTTATNSNDLTLADSFASNSVGITYDLGLYTCSGLGTSVSGLTLSDGNNIILSDNPDSTLSSDDTIENRMRYLAKYKTDSTKIDDVNIDWINVPSIPVGFSVPALYLSDCIDGTRDLDTGKTYDTITYSEYSTPAANDAATRIKMNRYLLGWSKTVGSHLPSAYSDMTNEIGDMLIGTGRGEYQVACDADLLGTATTSGAEGNKIGSEDDVANKWIWTSAIGYTTGDGRGRGARIVGYNGCGAQAGTSTGSRYGDIAARFVVRP